jgi:hypothetical protein
MIQLQPKSRDQYLAEGVSLAKGKWRGMCGSLVEEDEYRAAITAICLENTARWMTNLQEDTKVANVGVFDKFALPIIRAVIPNLIATDIVSVQPMEGPVSLIFFLATRYGKTKGTALKGQEITSPLTGHNAQYRYTAEVVDTEAVGAGDGSTAAPALSNLSWLPIRPQSVSISTEISSATSVATDDGNGVLVGADVASGTINYATGAIAITWDTAPDDGADVTASYAYDSEGNENLPALDIMLTSSPITARAHKLRARWSVEAAQDLKAVHNLDVEQELMANIAEEVRYEIDRGIITDLVNVADSASVVAWDTTPPTNVPDYTHRLTFVYKLIEASNLVFSRTKRATANWMVCGLDVASIVESLPNFQPTAVSGPGIVHMGTLQGRWEVYKDPWMDAKTALVGYKGTTFTDTGYVYAPYVPLYRTPVIYLDDMIGRVGLMSRYGKKLVNDDFFVKFTITTS